MQPDSVLPNQFHRNCVIGRATDKLDPDPSHACNHYGRDRINLGAIPGVSSFSPAGSQGFLPTLHPAVKLDALPGSSGHGEIALDGVLGRTMILVAAVDTGGVWRGDRRFDDRASETGEAPSAGGPPNISSAMADHPRIPASPRGSPAIPKAARKAHEPWRASG